MSDDPQEHGTVTESSVRVQRSPRYARFMIAGAVVFAVIALILTFAFPANPTYDRGAVFGFLLLLCGSVGVALGAIIALLIDRSTTRRARTVVADRVTVSAEEPERVEPHQVEHVDHGEIAAADETGDTQKSIEN